ncbi:hypothetical protein LQ356_01270 [Metamycoplasma faucium]|uniref:DNA processing/uptake protein n=1 Tax=Metamycoplasma faucium TaxID=56142 RepID=A0ABZ2TM35_9BACT
MNDMNYYLLYFSKKYNGDWDEIMSSLNRHEFVPKKYIESLKNDVLKKKIEFFTTLDEEIYPKSFEKLKKPPFLMYFKGNIDLLKSVDISKKDEFCILDIKQYFSNNDIVESLLSSGIKIILVLPCGLETNFIKNSLKSVLPNNLLIISEYSGNYYSHSKETEERTNLIINNLKTQLYGEEFNQKDNYYEKLINWSNEILKKYQKINVKKQKT